MGNEKIDQCIKRYTGNTDAIYVGNGAAGPTTVTSTWSGGKAFGAIMFLRDCNLTSVTSTDIINSTNLSSATTFQSGSMFIGKFTKVEFTTNDGAMVYTYE